jgi:hypothetical protein
LTSTALLAASLWRPETSTVTKLLTLACLGTLATLVGLMLWKRRAGRVLVVGVPLGLGLFLTMPGRATDAAALRSAYLDELRRFDGTEYVWGGETGRGIDCSGLVRVSLLRATAGQALARLDPALARRALELWWFDASARALGEGYRGWTEPVLESERLLDVDATRLQPGDLAVTRDGLHVLAYLGDEAWIQADPAQMRTHIDRLAPELGGWFLRPVRIVRWSMLRG